MAVQQFLMTGTSAVSRTTISGELWTWGRGSEGNLGTGGTSHSRDNPVQVGSLTTWQNTISGYPEYTCVTVKSDGTLWGWGNNPNGEVGCGNTTQQNSPVQVGSDTDWAEATTGGGHSLGIKTDGTLYGWGKNTYGAVGDGTNTNRSSPVQIGSDTDWLHAVCNGSWSSLALKTTGAIYRWGRDESTDPNSPTQIGSATDWSDIFSAGSGSWMNAFAIKKV